MLFFGEYFFDIFIISASAPFTPRDAASAYFASAITPLLTIFASPPARIRMPP
jgi:hypothetical protein